MKKVLGKVLVISTFAFAVSLFANAESMAAVTLPKPVAEYDFDSVSGKNITNTGSNKNIGNAVITGNGTIVSDTERGKVFYNRDSSEFSVSVRKNYLKLPSNTFSDGINGEFTLAMWVKIDTTNVKIGGWEPSEWADLFVAYNSNQWDKYPMTKLGVNMIGRVNNTYEDPNAYFDSVSNYDVFSDNKWHHIVFTISSNYTGVYADGKLLHSITLNGNPGAYIGNFLTSEKNKLDMVCIGGNSLWNNDPDICAKFDDVSIYDKALSAAQVKELASSTSKAPKVIEDGVKITGYIKAGSNVPYTLVSGKVSASNVSKYEWFVGDKLVSSSKNYAPAKNDIENEITLKVTLKDGSVSYGIGYFSLLPVLYIDSATTYNNVTKENYVDTDFKLYANGYDESKLYNGDAKIKLRGNSTSGLAKKPFKVKLDDKTNIFGMGKSKHWVLLANGIDLTMMRNKMLQGLAGDLGLDNMESELVTLIYNGEYVGIYELSEHVRIGSTRVDIYDWEELAEDAAKAISKELVSKGIITEAQRDDVKDELNDELTADYSWITSNTHKITSAYLKKLGKTNTFNLADYLDFNKVPDITGGALLEMDFWVGDNANLLTAYNQPIYMNTPSAESKFPVLESYLKKYVQAMEYSLHSTDFIYHNNETHYKVSNKGYYDWNTQKRLGVAYTTNIFSAKEYDGWHYTDFLDMDSAVNNMIICEFSLNWDCMKNSFFMYKDVDEKIVFGPVWDFDWAWGNSMGQDTNAPETWQTTNEWFANEQYYQTVQFNRMLIRDPYFIVKLYERYNEVRDEYIAPIVKTDIKKTYDFNLKAGLANQKRWNGAFSATAGQTYEAQYNHIKTFLNKRLTWMDKQFSSVDSLITSLGYYKTSDKIKTSKLDTTSTKGYTVISVKVSDAAIKKVSFQVNGKNLYTATVKNGTATVKVPDSVLTKENGKLNVVQYRAMDGNGKYIVNSTGTENGNYTNAISNYTTFKKKISADTGNQGGTQGGQNAPTTNNENITTDTEGNTIVTNDETTVNDENNSSEQSGTNGKPDNDNSSENTGNNTGDNDNNQKDDDENDKDDSGKPVGWIIPVLAAILGIAAISGGVVTIIIILKKCEKK